MQSPSPPPLSRKESKSHKRAASPDEHTSAKKKSRISGPAAVSDVTSALHKMASSFNDGDNGGPSTPQRRSMAIRAIEKDQELNGEERIKAMRLFKRDIAATDMYLAINYSAVRAEVIRLEIEDF
jgi:hypothetical protein